MARNTATGRPPSIDSSCAGHYFTAPWREAGLSRDLYYHYRDFIEYVVWEDYRLLGPEGLEPFFEKIPSAQVTLIDGGESSATHLVPASAPGDQAIGALAGDGLIKCCVVRQWLESVPGQRRTQFFLCPAPHQQHSVADDGSSYLGELVLFT